MKCGRNFVADHPRCVSDFANACYTVAIRHGRDEAVIGKHEILPFIRFHDHGFSGCAHRGINDDKKNRAGWIVRRHTGQNCAPSAIEKGVT